MVVADIFNCLYVNNFSKLTADYSLFYFRIEGSISEHVANHNFVAVLFNGGNKLFKLFKLGTLFGQCRKRNIAFFKQGSVLFSLFFAYRLFCQLSSDVVGGGSEKLCSHCIFPDSRSYQDIDTDGAGVLYGKLLFVGNCRICFWNSIRSYSQLENKYTDFGAIVIGNTIEKVIEQKTGKNKKRHVNAKITFFIILLQL